MGLASGSLTSIRQNDLVTAASELLGTAETSHETGVKWVYDYYDDWDASARFPDLDYREAPGGRLPYNNNNNNNGSF